MNQAAVASLAWAVLCVGACERPSNETPTDAQVIQTGIASFYGEEFGGRETASGESLKLNDMTAASRTLPLGSSVKVQNLETGQSASVRINDRGPYAEGRIIDLTPKAAQHIGLDHEQGVAQVQISVPGHP